MENSSSTIIFSAITSVHRKKSGSNELVTIANKNCLARISIYCHNEKRFSVRGHYIGASKQLIFNAAIGPGSPLPILHDENKRCVMLHANNTSSYKVNIFYLGFNLLYFIDFYELGLIELHELLHFLLTGAATSFLLHIL